MNGSEVVDAGIATGSCHVSSNWASLAVLQIVHVLCKKLELICGRIMEGEYLSNVVPSEYIAYGGSAHDPGFICIEVSGGT